MKKNCPNNIYCYECLGWEIVPTRGRLANQDLTIATKADGGKIHKGGTECSACLLN